MVGQQPQNGPISVLLVDDDDELRSFLTSLMPEWLLVVEAKRLSQARELLAQQTFQLAIIDGLLPDGTGIELISELRRRGADLPIIFMSAFWRDIRSYRSLTEELKVSRIMHKPFLAGEFLAQLEGLLAQMAEDELFWREASPPLAEPQQRQEDIEAKLIVLREAYQQRLEQRTQQLGQALAAARVEPAHRALLEEAFQLAHRLHGSAGAYGFSEVSAAAGSIETVLNDLLQDRLGGAVAWKQVDNDFQRLHVARQRRLELAQEESARPDRGHRYDLTLLVGDSDPRFLEEIQRLAREQLVEVIPVADEQSLQQVALQRPLDGAIINMAWSSQESGFQLVQKLRSEGNLASLPVAFVSDNDAVLNRIAATYAGGSLFLTKPLKAQQLLTAIEHFRAIKRAEQPRILLVDDDPSFAMHVSSILEQEQMRVTHLADPVRILDVLTEVRPDVLLLDVVMPSLSGYDVCKMIRSTPDWQSLPIIFLTVKLGAADRLACFESGGDDYLPKPILTAELLARMHVRVERSRILNERVKRDSLTGLLARQAFIEVVQTRLAENRRALTPFSLCLLDLDQFKQINDRHGHLAGDQVLRTLGGMLRGRFRTEDVRGRWGGEEFVIGFNGIGSEAASEMVNRVLQELREMTFEGDDLIHFSTSFSAGVALFPDDGTGLEDLVRAADRRLYQAKAAGRSRIIF